MIAFALDRRSGVPTYVQLQHQVKHAMRTGELRLGDRLPSAREVVAALGINPNTVLKAYREMEFAGLIEVRQGQGTFVALELETIETSDLARVRRDLARWIGTAVDMGLQGDDLFEVFLAEIDHAHRAEQVG